MCKLGFYVSDTHVNRILTGNDGTAKVTVIESLDCAKYTMAIPQLLELLAEEDYIVNSAIIPFFIKTNDPLLLCSVKEYLLGIDLVYPELDNFDKFQAHNRFLGYLLHDLRDEPSFIHEIVITNLQNMCSQKYLLEAFEAVSDVNSRKSEPWTSTVELLAAIGYQPAINIILYAIEYPNNNELFHEELNIVERLQLKEAIPYLISLLMQSYLLPSNHEKEMVVRVLSDFKISSTLPLMSSLRNSTLRDPAINVGNQINKYNRDFFTYQFAVIKIQDNCKFYNYDILQDAPAPISSSNMVVHQTYNTYNNVDRVGNLNTGSVQVDGDMIGEQHN